MKNWFSNTLKGLRETARDMAAPWRRLPQLSALQAAGTSAMPQKIAAQQFRTVVLELPDNGWAAAGGVVLFILVLWHFSPGARAVCWGVAALANVGSVTLFHRRFLRAQPADEDLRAWEVGLSRLTGVMGVVWGVVGFGVSPQATWLAPYFAFGSLLTMAGSLGIYGPYRPSISWQVPYTALLTVAYLVSLGGVLHVALGLGVVAAVVPMVRLTRVQNTLITQAMLVAEERLSLLNELEAQRSRPIRPKRGFWRA